MVKALDLEVDEELRNSNLDGTRDEALGKICFRVHRAKVKPRNKSVACRGRSSIKGPCSMSSSVNGHV